MLQAQASTKPVYKVGREIFTISNCDPDFEKVVEALLPHCTESGITTEAVCDISTGCTKDIRALLNHLLKRHSKCIWIDASCVVSPKGKKVLMAGASGAGKSTTAMALALGHGWKVLGEDIVLVDLKTHQILKFGSPFSMKEGTEIRLKEAVGRAPEEVFFNEWVPLREMAAADHVEAKLDLAIFFSPPFAGSAVNPAKLHAAEYVRLLLPRSNLLRRPGSADALVDILADAQCLAIEGGSLPERLDLILSICD